jgi:hypothetical protein
MPNGGVPINMVLRPKAQSEYVVYCHGAELTIQREADLSAEGNREPVLVLDREEALVLERFLRYWLGDEGSGPLSARSSTVDCVFDF